MSILKIIMSSSRKKIEIPTYLPTSPPTHLQVGFINVTDSLIVARVPKLPRLPPPSKATSQRNTGQCVSITMAEKMRAMTSHRDGRGDDDDDDNDDDGAPLNEVH